MLGGGLLFLTWCLHGICIKGEEASQLLLPSYGEKQRGGAFLLTPSTPFTLASLASPGLLPSSDKLTGWQLSSPHPLLAGEGTSPSVQGSLLVWGEVGVQWANENIRIPGSHLKYLEEKVLGSKVSSDLD